MDFKILYIPLDDRPVNTRFVEQLGDIAGAEIVSPPKSYLGRFMERGNRENISNWLLGSRGDVLLISLDMLLYGGLIASRGIETTYEEAVMFLETLRRFKDRNKNIRIYGFSNIMRLSISIDGNQSHLWWQKINRYNELRYRIEVLGEDGCASELGELLQEVPERIIDIYLSARKRNHLINLEAVKLVAEGVLDLLILSQEDCSPHGLHVMEHRKIEEEIKRNDLEDRVWVYPGADEIGQVLLARALQDRFSFYPRVFVDYDSEDGKNIVPKFEDRPLEVTLGRHLESLGVRRVFSAEGCDFIFAVSTPNLPYIDHMEGDVRGYNKEKESEALILRVKDYVSLGKPVFLADLACSNGGAPYLVKRIFEEKLFLSLGGYSGWNTAGNALGTAIAHGSIASLAEKRGEFDKVKSLKFLIERYADDFIYQAITRWAAAKIAVEKGLSPFNLGKKDEEIEAYITGELSRRAKESLDGREFSYLGMGGRLRIIDVRGWLPWNRVFEAECEVDFEVEGACNEN